MLKKKTWTTKPAMRILFACLGVNGGTRLSLRADWLTPTNAAPAICVVIVNVSATANATKFESDECYFRTRTDK